MEDERSTEGFATATYYDILGVAPVASHDEVKRAYLEHKLRFKQEAMAPVAAGGGRAPATAASERAQFRLLEVDMAWATLRNPAARARYDDELAAARRDGRGEAAAVGRPGAGVAGAEAPTRATVVRGAPPRPTAFDRPRSTEGPAPVLGRGPRFPGVLSSQGEVATPVPSDLMGARSHRRPTRSAAAARTVAGRGPGGGVALDAGIADDRVLGAELRSRTDPRTDDAGATLAVGGHSASIWEQRRMAALAEHGVDLDGAAVLAPASTAPVAPPRRSTRWAPLIIGAVVLGLVLGWGAVASRRPDPGVSIQTTQLFGPGRCLRFVGDPTVGLPVTDANGAHLAQSVSCDEPHALRIISRVPFPTACPRGTPEVMTTENVSVCVVPG